MPTADPNQINDLIGTVGNLSALGLIAWLVRHTFANTIPRLVDDFTKALENHRKEFTAALETHRKEFTAALTDQRAEFLGEMRSYREEVRDERLRCNECLTSLQQEFERLRVADSKG